jgi:hypothetical protein
MKRKGEGGMGTREGASVRGPGRAMERIGGKGAL